MTAESFRLPGHTGAPLRFRFNDRELTGREGDTVAAALLANGIHFVARSFKYHRPRGPLAAGAEEPNAIVTIGEGSRLDTNTQATRVELTEGLCARSINCWPSLRWDLGGLVGRLGRFIPAGFYYKTFFRPNWHFFEPSIRRMAGLGTAPTTADPDLYEHLNRHCDVVVVGSGPAGLCAALSAGKAGADVLLAEQDSVVGGSLLWEKQTLDGLPGRQWVRDRLTEISAMNNVTVLARTTVLGYYDHNFLTAVEHRSPRQGNRHVPLRQILWRIRAAQVILATGAIERPLVFPGNDRPGIMLASAVRHYLARFLVAVGRSVVVVTNNDDAYSTVRQLLDAGITVVAIVDRRATPRIVVPDVPLYRASAIAATRGRHRVTAVLVKTLDGSRAEWLACDAVAMSGGWTPAVQLFSQSGGTLRFDAQLSAFVPDVRAQATQVAGAAAGSVTLDACLKSGSTAGAAAATALGLSPSVEAVWRPESADGTDIEPLWQVPASIAGSMGQWIDFHNDVTVADVALAATENFRSVEHLKRYTTLGMAPDQGKTSNVNGLAVLGELTARTPEEVGTTTFRPPCSPVSFGVISGNEGRESFHPARRLPTHDCQTLLEAKLDDYGGWLRPAFYGVGHASSADCIAREVHAVRQRVGIMDYSPLGKIEVAGRDAGEFLNRMVIANVTALQRGQARYSLTLNEAGTITDDGVISRLADGSLLMGTTSGGSSRIFGLLDEWRQCQWPELDVSLTNVTGQWGVVLLSGPKARELLARIGTGIDLAPAAFPHMCLREGQLAGVPIRVHRVSFTGEASFEVSIPSGYAADLWELLIDHGEDLGVLPVGLEALDVLRTEKGYFHVGGDTDGTTVPNDVGFGAMARAKKSDYVGKRSLLLPALNEPRRLQLIGVVPLNSAAPLDVGAQLLQPGTPLAGSGEGFVTSAVWSPSLRRPLALAMLAAGRSRFGEQLEAWNAGSARRVEVVSPRFYDPEGLRLNA